MTLGTECPIPPPASVLRMRVEQWTVE